MKYKFFPSLSFFLFVSITVSELGANTILPVNANLATPQISIEIPGMDRLFSTKNSSSDLGNGSFSWVGEVQGSIPGFLSLVKVGNYYNGSILMSNGNFVSFRGETGEIEFKKGRKTHKRCGGCRLQNHLPRDPRRGAQPRLSWHNGDANLIDLLVVYPTVVKSAAGGQVAIEALIKGAVADANLCFRNSEVPVQIRLVHMEEVSYTPTGTLDIELDRLENASDGYMDNVHTLRDAYGADLVSLITSESDSGGLASTMSHPSLSFASSGFNVNVWDQLGAPTYTLAHEIGHNMGCLHNREDADANESDYNFYQFSYGKRWIENGQGYATVMSYDTKPVSTYPTTIPYFSNPTVTYLTTATGNTNSEDNAKVLISTAPYVSNFRKSVVQSILPTAFSYSVNEGNSTSFTVRLSVEPSSNVSVSMAISGDSDLQISGPTVLNFDSGNWNLPHPVQISAQADSDSLNGTATLVLSASGMNSTSLQISEIDRGTSLESNFLISGTVQNGLGMGMKAVSLQFSTGEASIQTDENGTFRALLPANWNGSITPVLSGYTFSPTSLSVNSVSGNLLGKQFQANRSSILYVNQNASGRGDGTSWQDAHTDLTSALISQSQYSEVWVAQGTYFPGVTKADSFILPPAIPVYGGFSGIESSRVERNATNNVTILSGDIGISGDGSDNSYHVVVASHQSTLDGFTIRDGNASQNFTNDDRGIGAGLHADSAEITVSNCKFINNSSFQSGGAIHLNEVNATISDCIFTGQYATKGGAIDLNNSVLVLNNSEFSNNSSELEGGAILSQDSDLNMSGCTFSANQNTTNNGGGALQIVQGTFSDENSTFSNNLTPSKGGGINAENATLTFFKTSFQGNQSVFRGGAVRATDCNVTATGVNLTSNASSNNSGGGFYVENGSFTDLNGTYSQNTAAFRGGAIRLIDCNVTLSGSAFTSNTSSGSSGGAVYVENGSFNESNCVYSQNKSAYEGGALVLKNVPAQLNQSIFNSNQNLTTNGAGAIYLNNSNASIQTCSFSSNSAVFQGGAIMAENASGSIVDSNFSQNINTNANGGGALSLTNSPLEISGSEFIGNISQQSYGGAITMTNSSPVIQGTLFSLNQTGSFDGGAIHIGGTSNPSIRENTFSNNSAGQSGGAINIDSSANPTIVNNIFNYNSSAGWGGAVYNKANNFTLSEATFLGNYSNLGGAFSSEGSSIVLSRVYFLGNEANSSTSSSGGAIYLSTGASSSTFVNCVFSGNKSLGRNGVIRPKGQSRFVNCSLTGNEAGTLGGITILFNPDSISLDNCLVWGNSASTANDIYVNTGSASANYSLFNPSESSGTISGSNNVSSDPLFVDANGASNLKGTLDDNLTLQSSSPAINQGSSSVANYSSVDLNGRIRDANPDMGAYEYSSNVSPVFSTNSSVSVSENQTAVLDVNSTDSDGDSLSYSISGGADQAKFQIDSGTGVLTFINSPDFEIPSDADGDGVYEVTVSVSDSTDTVTQEIQITVTDGVDALETFTVSGGQFSSPFYTITNSAGSAVDWSTYSLQKGATYHFVASNISSSHPFMIGESYGDTASSLVSGGPLTSSNNGDRIILSIPVGFSGQLLYFCTAHSGMKQSLIIANQSPVIAGGENALSFSLSQTGSLSYDLNASDADGDTLSWTLSSAASNGTASINSGTGVLSYSPGTNYSGNDSLTVQVSDGSLTDSLVINLTITAVNDAPVISEANATLNLSLPEDGTFAYDLNASDSDGDTLSWSLSGGASNGTASINSGTGVLRYSPGTNYSGNDTLNVTVSDGSLTDSLVINLTITAVNDAPVISEANTTLNLSLSEDGTFAYDLNASDAEGDTLSWTLSSGASNGTASINSGTGVLRYSPVANYSGNDSLTVLVSDGSLTDVVGINLSVIPFNDVPTSISLSHSSFQEEQEAGTIVGTFSTVDVDLNDTHSYSLISGSGSGNNLFSMDSNGTLRTATVFDYESNASSFSITVRVMDDQNASLDGNFSISLLNDESDDPANPSPESVVLLSDGISVSAGWKQAGWFGYYFAQSYPWVYHGSLGWVYVSESNTTGTWLYRDTLGWLWTNPNLFPYIFRNTASGWLYLDTSHGPLRYYDYSVPRWMVVE